MISFSLDWDHQAMTLDDFSPNLRQLYPAGNTLSPLAPLILPLEYLSQQFALENGGAHAQNPVHFLIDCQYEHDRVAFRLHISEEYASVVNVPPEQLRETLQDLLTPRETDIAVLLFQGDTIRTIAGGLCIAEGTVKRTIYNIYQKLQINSQVELIREMYVLLAQRASGKSTE
jgi:DNA-binding CsgD family transcriptional regulator